MEEFNITQIAALARKRIKTESGAQAAISREPLACVLSDYCQARGIDQDALMRELGMDPAHPLAQERFNKLAMVTVDVGALARILVSGGAEQREDDVA